MNLNTIGNGKRISRYDPDLARKAAEEYEQEKRRKKLQDKLKGKKQEQEIPRTTTPTQIQNGMQELIYNDLGKEILRIHNEKFKGKSKIEDLTQYQDAQPISFSNVPRALSYNTYLLQNYNSGLLSPEEVIQNWNNIPNKENTYSDTNSIAIYTNQGPNEERRKEVLRLIGKSSIRIPYIVYNLGVEPAGNEQGFIFTGSDFLHYEEAPFLRQDGKLSYDGNKLVNSDQGIAVYTPANQDGLRRVYRVRAYWLGAWDDGLLNSDEAGRVNFARRARKNF